MAGRERSRGGCWTCKLRKKKCDERRPSCAICDELSATCYGYGSRPLWMNGGTAEKSILEAVRRTVRETTSRKRKTKYKLTAGQRQSTVDDQEQDDDSPTIVPTNPISQSKSGGSPCTPRNSARVVDRPPRHTANIESFTSRPTPEFINVIDLDQKDNRLSSLSEDEVRLLMHYIDYVFPLQFPSYKPTPADGGRGWLLSLLMKVKPLYHAALSIASYHEHYVLYYRDNDASDFPSCPRLDEQLRQYGLSIERLRRYLERFKNSETQISLNDYVEVLACMTMLVSLEVFIGDGDTWKLHLPAALRLLPEIEAAYMNTQLSATYNAALNFFASVLYWYSVLQSSNSGQQVCVESLRCFGEMKKLPLQQVMGCADWVMLCIKNTAELSNWKDSMQSGKQLSIRDLATRAATIETLLEDGLKRISAATERTLDNIVLTPSSKSKQLQVTRIFAHAALVYLHVVVSGAYPELPEIQSNVTQTITAFQAVPHPDIMLSLTWPLCIAGSMATGDNESAFRALVSASNVGQFTFGSSEHALRIMEECWRLRRSPDLALDTVKWTDGVRSLGLQILII